MLYLKTSLNEHSDQKARTGSVALRLLELAVRRIECEPPSQPFTVRLPCMSRLISGSSGTFRITIEVAESNLFLYPLSFILMLYVIAIVSNNPYL